MPFESRGILGKQTCGSSQKDAEVPQETMREMSLELFYALTTAVVQQVQTRTWLATSGVASASVGI